MKRTYIFLFSLILCSLLGCSKEDEWLDTKYNKGDVVPKTLKDFQALLNNEAIMNQSYCVLGLIATDNYFLTTNNWKTLPFHERNSYIWAKEIYATNISGDWQLAYAKVFISNVVLDGIKNIEQTPSNQAEYALAKGSALFFRAFQFYSLVQTFAKPFSATAATDPGIPLRLTSDVNERSERGTVAGAYARIIADLKEAESLLPTLQATKTLASKTAAQALLARVYLGMGDYPNALTYASRALDNYSTLMNYAERNAALPNPFPNFISLQPENIFNCYNQLSEAVYQSRIGWVDSVFYESYHPDDLRKSLYYRADPLPSRKVVFRGSYAGVPSILFAGLATNELYFIKAEGLARASKVTEAMDVLNAIMIKRWKTNSFTPFTASNADQAIALVLEHRRKELPFTGILRWEDLRRLNQTPATAVTLKRIVDGNTYTLPPNDPRYAFPIPKQEQDIYGLADNPR